jgi:hypothetical protein
MVLIVEQSQSLQEQKKKHKVFSMKKKSVSVKKGKSTFILLIIQLKLMMKKDIFSPLIL